MTAKKKRAKTCHESEVEKVKRLLTYLLAAYVLTQSEKPVNCVLDQLLDVETDAANLVSKYIKNKNRNPIHLSGSLAGIFSIIQMSQSISRAPKII